MRLGYKMVLGTALLVTGTLACPDDTPLYLGGPPGAATSLQLSNSAVAVVVGDSVPIGAVARDEAGNETATAVTLTACNAAVATLTGQGAGAPWSTTAFVKGVELGTTCVRAAADGLQDSIIVRTGPAGMLVVGPDTVGSGNTATYTVNAVDVAGNALSGAPEYEWSSSSKAQLAVAAATGEAAGRGTGSVSIYVRAPGGGNARKTLVVAPGVFGGTLSASSAGPGALITATKAADGASWDADTKVSVGGVAAFVDLITPSNLTFAVPATGSTAQGVLAFSAIGPDQLAQNGTFTVTKANEDLYSPGNITNDCSDPTNAPDFSAVKSALSWVYLVHDGTAQGSRGCQNSGAVTGYDHYLVYTTGATDEVIDVEARWTLSGDNDIIVCTTDYSSCPGFGFSGGTLAELDAVNLQLAANTSYFIIFSPWTANAGVNNVRIKVTKD